MDPAIVSMTKTVCCGLQESSLGRFFNQYMHDNKLSIGTTVMGLHSKNRTAGVAAHVTSSKYLKKNIIINNFTLSFQQNLPPDN